MAKVKLIIEVDYTPLLWVEIESAQARCPWELAMEITNTLRRSYAMSGLNRPLPTPNRHIDGGVPSQRSRRLYANPYDDTLRAQEPRLGPGLRWSNF